MRFSFRNPGGHRDGIALLRISHTRFPHYFPGLGIESLKPSIYDGRDNHVLINGEAAINNSAADFRKHGRLINFRIPAPLFLAGARIKRKNDAPVGDSVQRPIEDILETGHWGTVAGSSV